MSGSDENYDVFGNEYDGRERKKAVLSNFSFCFYC